MPNGFVGMASKRYLGDVSQAHRNALTTIDQSRVQAPENSPQVPRPRRLPFVLEDASVGRHISGMGSSGNIVVSQREYNEVMVKIRGADEKMGRCIYSVCSEIEDLCRTMFIMPAVAPRCLNVCGSVKTSLPDFGSVTEGCLSEMLGFARDIDSIGH